MYCKSKRTRGLRRYTKRQPDIQLETVFDYALAGEWTPITAKITNQDDRDQELSVTVQGEEGTFSFDRI